MNNYSTFAQSQKNNQLVNLYFSIHGEVKNIKFGHQVILIVSVSLGTLTQEVGNVITS